MIGVLVSQPEADATRTYTASSSIDGALGVAANYLTTGNKACVVLYLHGASAGNHTITASAGGAGSVVAEAVPFYETGLDSGASPIVGTFTDGSNTNTHFNAASGSIDTTTGALIVCTAAFTSAAGVTAKAAGVSPAYTAITTVFNGAFYQYRDAASAATDDRGEWTHTGTARVAGGTMVAFPYAAPPATGNPWFTYRQLRVR